MSPMIFDRIPTNLPGGFFVYRAAQSEEICFADRNVLDLYGCDTMEQFRALTGNSFRGMVHPDDLERVEEEIHAQTVDSDERHDYVHYRIRTRQGDVKYAEDFGHLVRDDNGEEFFYVFIVDVEESKYREMSRDDWKGKVGFRRTERLNSLTGLVYEKGFYGRCEKNLNNPKINWLMIAIDLQNFKLFNEWYGREAGDAVLADVGHALKAIAEANNGVAGYFGSDDFALLVPAGHFDADDLFERIHRIVTDRGASIGFMPAIGASYSQGNMSAYRLYDQASIACKESKGDLKTRVRFFSQAMVSRVEEDYTMLSDFKKAMTDGEITFYLQPQCQSTTGRVVGAEALARWIRPDGSVVPPLSFIPTLEKYGFAPDLDKYIWEEVCKWSRRVLDAGMPMVPVSVNISPVDIFTMDVPRCIRNLVEKYDLPRDAIKLEITESAYSEDSEMVRATVQDFRNMGFVVLMDDFGSGFSSLNMLRELNVDIIKLDAYFLRMDKNNERKGMHIIESVVNMAKTMAMPVIVEGVETKEQCDYLLGLGIRYIQGYYFYRPMSTADFEALVADGKHVDPDGFACKANEEFRMREFLNDTVYSDSMLNHIIGPAAIYALHGDDVDIIRFNEMFYRAVNVPDFQSKLLSIQKVMPGKEAQRLFETLKQAYEDRLNGAGGMFTFRKIDGSAARFLIHFYFLNEDDEQRRFYGAARDVSELSNLYRHMELLSRFTSRTVLFLLYNQGEYSFEVTAHGMEREMGLSRAQLTDELNSGAFYKRLIGAAQTVLWNIAQTCAERRVSSSTDLTFKRDDGGELKLVVDADNVDDELGDVRCILSIRKK